MKKIVMMVLVIGVMLLAGCGDASASLDGVWETEMDEDEIDVLTIDGDKGVLESEYFLEIYTAEIDRSAKTVTIAGRTSDQTIYDYELMQDKLVLTEKTESDDKMIFVYHRKDSGE